MTDYLMLICEFNWWEAEFNSKLGKNLKSLVHGILERAHQTETLGREWDRNVYVNVV
jgi:hypothetical protein